LIRQDVRDHVLLRNVRADLFDLLLARRLAAAVERVPDDQEHDERQNDRPVADREVEDQK